MQSWYINVITINQDTKAYSEPTEVSKMELSVKIVNSFQPFTTFYKKPEGAVHRYSTSNVLLKTLNNSQENTCVGDSF